jgi:peptidyl-prolyl cis-trans isomerase A (cyclophilin A)
MGTVETVLNANVLRVLLSAAALALSLTPGAAVSEQAAPDGLVGVRIETAMGRIDAVVDAVHAPATAANFLRYVDQGLYDGGRFHRTVRPDTETNKTVPIEVIQASRALQTKAFDAIALERTSKTGLRHLDGALSMARVGPDSATSDFFICIGPQPELDEGGKRNADGQGFAVFGHVTAGMDVVRRIQGAPVAANSQSLAPPVGIQSIQRIRAGG